jgi:hypothetical protein
MILVELVLILSSFDVSGIFCYFSLRVMTQQKYGLACVTV